jgi:hypothetical protein
LRYLILLRAKWHSVAVKFELPMLRWMMPLVAMFALAAAKLPDPPARPRRAVPPANATGLRAHYRFRTTVAPAAPYRSAQSLVDGPDVLFTPSTGYVRYIPPAVGVAFLPVEYGVPWYAGPDVTYWNGWSYGYGCGLNSYGNPWC